MSKQTQYNKVWQEKNKERNLYLNLRSKTRSFIKNRATLEDLDELKALIYERETNLKNYTGAKTMKKYTLIVNGVMEDFTYSDVEEAKIEVFEILKEEIGKRNIIESDYSISEIPVETDEELAAKGGRCADLIDVLDYSKVVRVINEMMDTYDSVGIMQAGNGIMIYGKEDENGEDKDVYLVEQNGNFVRE